jgi:hypothetical protein
MYTSVSVVECDHIEIAFGGTNTAVVLNAADTLELIEKLEAALEEVSQNNMMDTIE